MISLNLNIIGPVNVFFFHFADFILRALVDSSTTWVITFYPPVLYMQVCSDWLGPTDKTLLRNFRDQLGPKFWLVEVEIVESKTQYTARYIVAFTNLGWISSSHFYRFPFVCRAPSQWSWHVRGVKTVQEEKGHQLTSASASHIVAIWLLCQQKGQLLVIS